MGSDKSFICCDKCSSWQKILQFTKETYSFTYFIFLGTIFIWSSNFNWLSSIIPKCFWEDVRVTLTLLNSNGGCTIFFNLRLKMTFWACLVVSGLKFIFHWVSQLVECLNVMSNRKQKRIICKKLATSKTWTRILGPDPEKPGPWKTWAQKNLDPEKTGPTKTWTLKSLDSKKRKKQLDVESHDAIFFGYDFYN